MSHEQELAELRRQLQEERESRLAAEKREEQEHESRLAAEKREEGSFPVSTLRLIFPNRITDAAEVSPTTW